MSRLAKQINCRIPMTITNSPVNKILYRLASVAVTTSFSCQLAIAADITRERGVNGESDVIPVRG